MKSKDELNHASSKLDLSISAMLKELAACTNNNLTEIAVKIVSEVTFEPLDKIVPFFLSGYGLKPVFEIGEFDQLNYEAYNIQDTQSDKLQFVYCHNSTLKYFVKASGTPRTDTTKNFNDLIDNYLTNIRKVIQRLDKSVVIINLFELPPYRIRGSHSTRSGIIKTINSANNQILDICNENKNVLIHDTNYVSANCGLDNWYDFGSWAAFKQPFSGTALKKFGASLSSVIAAHLGKSKKVLITDFDNTLWGGVIGDDGEDGLHIGPSSAKGEIFTLVQAYLYDLASSGIILGASSKNDEKNVRNIFQKDTSQLSLDDFAITKINWSPKSRNIIQILNDLNVGSDSSVFIDDNPAEILEVSNNVPDCSCVSYNKLAIEFMKTIDAMGFFESQVISKDDLSRNQSYQTNTHRNDLKESFEDYNDFLKALEMEACVFWNNSSDTQRLVSLTNKTNQFNTNQVKISKSEVDDYLSSPDKFILSSSLTDKFGPLGIVSVMFGHYNKNELTIKNWVLSCRVFQRGLEDVLLTQLVGQAKKMNISCIKASITDSPKNMYCRDVYKKFGFNQHKRSENKTDYSLSIDDYNEKQGPNNGSSITVTFS